MGGTSTISHLSVGSKCTTSPCNHGQALPTQPSPLIDPTFGGITVSSQGKRNGFERHRLFQVVKQNLVVRSNTLPRAWSKAETQQQGELGGGNQWLREWAGWGVGSRLWPGEQTAAQSCGRLWCWGGWHSGNFFFSFYQRRTVHVLDSVFKSVLQAAVWLKLIALMFYSEHK